MNGDATDVTVVLDRSGSMAGLADDTVGGFDAFVQGQEEAGTDAGTCRLTLVQFDTQDPAEVVFDALPIEEVPSLAGRFVPRGGTPLHDAVFATLARTGQRLAAMPEAERPGRVVFPIITDGHENSSQEATLAQVRGAIEHQSEAYGWEFAFIGSTLDAMDQGAGLGIVRERVMRKEATAQGERGNYRHVSASLARARRGRGSFELGSKG